MPTDTSKQAVKSISATSLGAVAVFDVATSSIGTVQIVGTGISGSPVVGVYASNDGETRGTLLATLSGSTLMTPTLELACTHVIVRVDTAAGAGTWKVHGCFKSDR